jgi:mRNA interferase MazF
VTYRAFDVVVVPFPFTDINASKRRPALVLSDEQKFNTPVGHSVMAMMTTAAHSSWSLDVPILDLPAAGLKTPSIVRMKLFTLDHALVLKHIGRLSAGDQSTVKRALHDLLPWLQ